MKNLFLFFLVFVFFSMFQSLLFAQNSADVLIVADFNSAQNPNNVGGDFGTWDYNPADDTQTCMMEFSLDDYALASEGHSLKLVYDVQSTRPAFNGFWMNVRGVDASLYNQLKFWVKGDTKLNYSRRFKVELKNILGQRAVYFVNNVQDEWTEVVIDFKKTGAIKDFSELTEFTIVFSDIVATHKEGAIYIDEISFVKSGDDVRSNLN